MAGLEDIAAGVPSDSENASLGAGRIRALTEKTKDSMELEHHLAGEHKIMSGGIAVRPSFGHSGRLFINTSSSSAELEYDTGNQWASLTKNTEFVAAGATLTTHMTEAVIDHPNQSVTTTKLADACVTASKMADGFLVKRHLDSGLSGLLEGDISVKPLVDGSTVDSSWHVHPALVVGITFISPHIVDGRNHLNEDWEERNLFAPDAEATFDATDVVPSNATAVLLEARCVGATNTEAGTPNSKPRVRVRAMGGDEYILVAGGFLGPMATGSINDTKIGFVGQGFCKLNKEDSKRRFQYKITGCNIMWEVRIVGWI